MGRHALVPFFRQDDMPIVADVCQSFILDNSAYTIWRKNGHMDYQGYIKYVEKWSKHPGFDFAIIPDSITGNSWENQMLLESWFTKAKGVPVWHPHEGIVRMKYLCAKYDTVAIGGSPRYPSPGSRDWWDRITEMMDAVCDDGGVPPCKLHGLRLMNPKIFARLPLSSADSTNAAQNYSQLDRFGMYTPPTSSQCAAVIAERIEVHNSAPVWSSTVRS